MGDELSAAELRRTLADATNTDSFSPTVEGLMRALDKKKLFRYHCDEPVSLLSTPGRVLLAIMEDPTLTQRAISVYLGCSETLVDKTVKALVDCGLITKTKVRRQNVYKIDAALINNHSDIQHLRDVVVLLDGQLPDLKVQPSVGVGVGRPQKIVSRVVSSEPF